MTPTLPLYVTGNPQKLAEAREIIPGLESVNIDLPELQGLNRTYLAEDKVERAFEKLGKPCFVEDVSLEIDRLGGLPGPMVKWFLQTLGAKGIVDLTRGSPAQVYCTIAYHNGERAHTIEGVVEGFIEGPRGPPVFGFDPIFLPNGHDQTFAEMSLDEKNAISHRHQALAALATYLHVEQESADS